MPANTPKGYPYPLGTDRVMDGDDAIHNLATAVDTKQPFAVCIGVASIVFAGTITGAISVTFPVGRFTQSPRVNATVYGTSVLFAYVNSASASSASIGARRYDGATVSATVAVHFEAVQMLADASDG